MDIHEAPTRLDANNWTTQKLRQAGWHATARASARKSVAPVPGQLQVGFVLMILDSEAGNMVNSSIAERSRLPEI